MSKQIINFITKELKVDYDYYPTEIFGKDYKIKINNQTFLIRYKKNQFGDNMITTFYSIDDKLIEIKKFELKNDFKLFKNYIKGKIKGVN